MDNKTVIKVSVAIVAGLLVCFGMFLLGRSSVSRISDFDAVWATVDGREIKGKDVWSLAEEDLKEIERQQFRAKKSAVDKFILSLSPTAQKPKALTDDELRATSEFQTFVKDRKIGLSSLTAQQRKDLIGNYKVFSEAMARRTLESSLMENKKIEWSIPIRLLSLTQQPPRPGLFRTKPTWKTYFNFHCPTCSKVGEVVREASLHSGSNIKMDHRFAVPMDETGLLREREDSIVYRAGIVYLCAVKAGKESEIFESLMAKAPLQFEELDSAIVAVGLKASDIKSSLESNSVKNEIRRNSEDAANEKARVGETILINGIASDIREPREWLESLSHTAASY
jgi:hypothetical protein